MTGWQIAFIVLQIVFTLCLGWFIRVMIVFVGDLKDLAKRVSTVERKQEVEEKMRVQIDSEIKGKLDELKKKFDSVTKIVINDRGDSDK